LARVVEALSTPWLLLGCRLWLGQIVLVRQVMAMMTSADHAWPNAAAGHALAGTPAGWGIDSAFYVAAPLCLMAGLLTRPIAVMLLLRVLVPAVVAAGATALPPAVALLAWLVAAGPGPLSLDGLLGRGLVWSAFGPAKGIAQCYAALTRGLQPLVLLLMRLATAALVIAPTWGAALGLRHLGLSGQPMLASLSLGWQLGIAVALALGIAARPAALSLAATVPLSGLTMSMDDRLTALLVFLTIAVSGAGLFSVDRLILGWARGVRDERDRIETDLPHVVVVGGGFGGVAAVRGLRSARCRITLIDRRNHHLFQPLLYQVATAALSPAEIATPIRGLFRHQGNVRVRLAEVTGVDATTREVLLGATRVGFNYLVLATGARHSYFGQDSWAGWAPGLKSIEDATAIRSRLLRAFEEAESAVDETDRAAWLTFVVIGGGPTGVELAGAIAELARHGMEREYRAIDPATARVILIQSGSRILPTFAPALSAAAERSLRGLGVDVRLDARVREVDAAGVTVGDQQLAARTVLWAAGVAASPAAQWLGRPSDNAGRLIVGQDLSVDGLPGIYVVGDTAACRAWRGDPVPGLAPAAKQAGSYAARAIRAALKGHPPPRAFRYRHFGSLATIGRQSAVVELGPVRLWGALAWWFWGAAHVAFLVGGRNRATVILDWLWAYLTYRRSTRLITGESSTNTLPTANVPRLPDALSEGSFQPDRVLSEHNTARPRGGS
jgi:NADH dehydrogenase/putative oxidoreductase